MSRTAQSLNVPVAALETFVDEVMGTAIHAATRGSLASFSVGLLGAKSMTLHRIGRAMSDAYSLQKKHTTKQIDRFLTHSSIDLNAAQMRLAEYALADRKEAMIAVDWTDYDHDNHATLCAYLLTTHGRALPLVWETHRKDKLKNRRTALELGLIERLATIISPEIQVIVLADRGFGYQDFVKKLHQLGLDFVLRIRKNTWIRNEKGERRRAGEWLHPSGRARMIQDVRITADETEVNAFVAVRSKAMKEGWFLVSSLSGHNSTTMIKLYGKRFSIEETFRDTKDDRFGLGLRATRIGQPLRRDRLLLICALAYIFIVTLGQAGEDAGVDGFLKVNTSKKRQLSLFNQGLHWLSALQNLRDSIKTPLLESFHKLLSRNDFSVLTMNDIYAMEK